MGILLDLMRNVGFLKTVCSRSTEKGVSFGLLPIDLCMAADRILDRGLPKIASPEAARTIAANMTAYSKPYGTKLVYDETDGLIHILS